MENILEWFQNIGTRYYKAVFENGRYISYIEGIKTTLLVSLISVIIGILIGFIVAMIKQANKRTGRFKIINAICSLYVTVIRGTPVYVQLLIFYYVIFASRGADAIIIGSLCFGINSGAYVSEIVRAGINAVDNGQMEAGRSLGLGSFHTMVTIIMPQAIKNILPALCNEFVVLVKETSIIGTIAVLDVTKVAQNIGARTYDYMPPLLFIAAIYLVIVTVLTRLIKIIERRMARSDRR